MNQSKPLKENILQYFDGQAVHYRNAGESWPWHWLRGRERAAVVSATGSVRGETVLDFGCGVGYYARVFMSLGAKKVVGVDMSEAMINQLREEEIEGIVGDITTVDLDHKFKRIVCAGVLEFTSKPGEVLENARSHIDLEGRLVLLVPLSNLWGQLYRLYHRLHGFQINLFRPEELTSLAQQAGWGQLQETYVLPFTWVASFGPID